MDSIKPNKSLVMCLHGYWSRKHCPACGRGLGIINERGQVTDEEELEYENQAQKFVSLSAQD
jgi:hypothetical protein